MLERPGLSWWTPEPAGVPLAELTLGGLLDQAAERYGRAEAVVTSAYADLGLNVRWTYERFRALADRLARGLMALSLGQGARVAIWAPNLPQWLVVEFAAAKAGLELVTVNPTYRAEELRFLLDDSGAEVLLLWPRLRQLDLAGELRAVRDQLPHVKSVWSLGPAEPGLRPLDELFDLGEAVPAADLTARQAAVNPRAVAQIQYTSGTTGRPKGAQLTHYGIVNNARLFAERWNVTAADRWCNPMPLFHTAGCGMVTCGAIWNGACQLPIVWFDPERVFATVAAERATILETVPTMIVRLLDEAPRAPRELGSLRIVGTGGSPTPPELGVRLAKEWGAKLRIVYGLTETSPLVTSVPEDDSDEHAFHTVGTPFPETEVRIIDREGRPTLIGEPGELCVRGYLVMAGYLNRPEATAEVIDADGWFHSGDVATMDADGYIRIIGRVKDVIIRGGENLYPAEIEALLGQHPAVVDAQVVGVPDPYYGEEACAAVVARGELDPDGLRAWLRQRVTHQKVPRYVVAVDEYPLTASGKVQKFKLRDQVIARLGLEGRT